MCLLLEAKSLPALIIKPRIVLVVHTDGLGWNITSNQQQHMLVQDLNRIVSWPNVMPGQILYCTTNCIPINLMSKENCLLTLKFETAWAMQMTSDWEEWSELPMGATTATCTRSGTSVSMRSSVQQHAWVVPTTNWLQPDTVAKLKVAALWLFVVVEHNH